MKRWLQEFEALGARLFRQQRGQPDGQDAVLYANADALHLGGLQIVVLRHTTANSK